jgi:hypothetical protein
LRPRLSPGLLLSLGRSQLQLKYLAVGPVSNERALEVEQGQVRTLEEVQEIFEHPRRSAWEEVYRPLLTTIPARQLEAETGIRESLLIRYRKGLIRPSARQLKRLVGALRFHLFRSGSSPLVRLRPLHRIIG